MDDRTNTLTLSFTSLQPNWPFMDFKTQVSSMNYFLILQEQLKNHHGCIKNIKIYLDYDKKNQLIYHSQDKIGQKLCSSSEGKTGSNSNKQITLYYEFDNGYEWPLLSF